MLSFSPRGVLDEILNLIESVSEEFPSYSFKSSKLKSPVIIMSLIPLSKAKSIDASISVRIDTSLNSEVYKMYRLRLSDG